MPLPKGLGTSVAPVFAPAGTRSQDIVVDDSGVYWTQQDTEGSIRHCPLAGCVGAPELLAAAIGPEAITTDIRALYWTTEKGLVMKLAK